MKLKIGVRCRIIDHQDSRFPLPQKMLQGENLPPIAERTLRQQPHLGPRVDNNARRIDTIDLIEQQLYRLAELDFRRPEHSLPIAVAFDIGRHQYTYLDSLERPAMRVRHGLQLAARLGHADIELYF